MNNNTLSGLRILGAALLLGALGDGLLRATPWGLNLCLWVIALIAVLLFLVRRQHVVLAGEGRWLLLPAAVFAMLFIWRDSPTLKSLDAGAIGVGLALAALRGRTGTIRFAGFWETMRCVFVACLNASFGPVLLLFGDIRWKQICGEGRLRHLVAAGRGLAIALPLLLVFGGLFASSDAVFAHYLGTVFQLDFNSLCLHVLLIGFYAWIVGGFLRCLLIEETKTIPASEFAVSPPPTQRMSLGPVEVGIVMGMLDLLFLSFVLIQLRYFFGGAALVHATVGMSYARYARSGFFELVTVAALVLPMLLTIHWRLRREDARSTRLFTWLSAIQIALLFVIMASAMQRMRLYQSECGLTELRLYTMAFMGWLGVVFVWFAATVLRGRRERFMFGAMLTGFAAIVVLHVVNPDNQIVQTNTSSDSLAVRIFDANYAMTLSADAIPALVDALPKLSGQQESDVRDYLRRYRDSADKSDWRSWNLARSQAWRAIASSPYAQSDLH